MTRPPASHPKPELALLLECARLQLDEAGAQRIHALLASPLDWEHVHSLALEHGVVPLLNLHLQSKGLVPSAQLQRFSDLSAKHARATVAFAAELFRVLEILQAEGIPAVPYKGPVIAAQAYGDPALRAYTDLDLILLHRDAAHACSALAAQGYVSEIPLAAINAGRIPGQYPFLRKGSQIHIELHTERTLRYFPRRLNIEEMLQCRESILFCGQSVAVFSAEDTLSLLCVHASKHFWERLMWIADIGALVQRPNGLHWARAFAQARQLGAGRMVRLGLLLAENLLGAILPDEVSKVARSDRGAVALMAHVRKKYFEEDHSAPGILERMTFRVRMRGKIFPGIGYLLRLATAPTEEDWGGAARGRMSGLASVLRPLRLARKYGLGRQRADKLVVEGEQKKRPRISPGP